VKFRVAIVGGEGGCDEKREDHGAINHNVHGNKIEEKKRNSYWVIIHAPII
jgi:hypothetical protein